MSCPRSNLLLRLVGGELSHAAEQELRRHLAECPRCAQALEALRGTWHDLGLWTVDSEDVELAHRVAARVAKEAPSNHDVPPAVWFGPAPFRVAASIVLAAGLGIATGTVLPADLVPWGPPSSPAPTSIELAEELGLTELATASATGLPVEFEAEVESDAEVEPS